MEWLKNDMIELGSYTGMQVLVVLMMLILLAFAIWAIRQSDTYRSLSFSDTPLINAVGWAALILALPGALLFVGTLATLFHLAVLFPDASGDESMQRRHATLLLSLLAAIGALVGLVFGLIRLFAVERQTKAQEEKNRLEGEALFNDKMTAATTDLYARRQTEDSAWQDDVPRRNSAIDRLEGLVHERPDQAPRVARLLSVYLRELSGADEVPAQTHPYIRAHALMYPKGGSKPLSAEEAAQKLNVTAEDISLAALQTWAYTLKPRSDMENAAQTLGRLRAIAGVDADAVTIDLRAANLQGIDFEGGNFNRARLEGAQLQGAKLRQAQMQGAKLWFAQMQGANLAGADAEGGALGAQMGQSCVTRKCRGQTCVTRKCRGQTYGTRKCRGQTCRTRKCRGQARQAQMQGRALARRCRGQTSARAVAGGKPLDAQMQGANLSARRCRGRHSFHRSLTQKPRLKMLILRVAQSVTLICRL